MITTNRRIKKGIQRGCDAVLNKCKKKLSSVLAAGFIKVLAIIIYFENKKVTKQQIHILKSHSGGYEEFYLLEYKTVLSAKVNRSFRGTRRLHLWD
jgi:hypothetical protein